jgi:glycosyltransferase involved in cell wall biosynthesis
MDLLRQTARSFLQRWTRHWPERSRLFLLGENQSWVINWEMRELSRIVRQLGIKLPAAFFYFHSRKQAVFYGSQFALLNDDWLSRDHAVATAYFHGKPGIGVKEFDALYERLKRHHEKISRLQVSHSEMRDLVLASGIESSKVHLIPIAVNLEFFPFRQEDDYRSARRKLSIPETAFVVGSFQKDGVGWGDGLEPKLIKGPDVFLQAMKQLKNSVPELHVLLSGPARGYVMKGLHELKIPFTHRLLKEYPEIKDFYHACDFYMVTSREEGGPKAVLESMACGVPLVTTRVGQAMDLVKHGANAWMVDSEDVEGLVQWAQWVHTHKGGLTPILAAGRKTAEANAYESQVPLWRAFFEGFVGGS